MTVATHDCPQQRGRTRPCTGRDCAGALHDCWHCHDDPPKGHTCPCCGALPRLLNVMDFAAMYDEQRPT